MSLAGGGSRRKKAGRKAATSKRRPAAVRGYFATGPGAAVTAVRSVRTHLAKAKGLLDKVARGERAGTGEYSNCRRAQDALHTAEYAAAAYPPVTRKALKKKLQGTLTTTKKRLTALCTVKRRRML